MPSVSFLLVDIKYMLPSYVAGSGYNEHDENLVADANNDIVVVVIQYRLGIFGFLSGNEVVEGGGALNAGLPLNVNGSSVCVQISKFGGDPSKVTIWGASAGAGSVLQHVIANGGNTQPPLFRAAMTSSTFLPSQYYYNDTIPETIYQTVVNGTGCNTSATPFACLRNVSADLLEQMNNYTNTNALYGVFTTVPMVDGKLIVEPPISTLVRGNVNGEILLAVTNSDEGALFVNTSALYPAADYIHNLFPLLPMGDVQKIAEAYANYTIAPGEVVPESRNVTQAIGIHGRMWAFNKAGKRAWKGLFAIPPGYHGGDVPYYFTSVGPPIDNPSLIASFSQSFISTAISLDPNNHLDSSDITPQWNTWV
ncbi:alpha beta-hydrolase [Coniophora puteana RWD-64-598 SS2]|uniref:Carboxylic ester hydrolase n=1 Tax=Coniophora puteana (strain RWD-64-598) TaxID=741705 RepID=A0A5M3MX94_CONPW|nr:alpha beta-hydrolase [Coniophora puteana RWD-64-598 SS2]EIW83627.1 alpha beta-hydrolase [Coniophora puteana RWD-64-598 SS2]